MSVVPVSLDTLGLKFGTDKSSKHHDYLRFYGRFFEKFRDKTCVILEIGVLGGSSLKTWEAYFERAKIVDVDINPSTIRFAGGRISIEIADQSNIEQLVAIGVKYGPFDIVIEDGSHMWDHQITSLKTLFPFVRPGGFFITEDLQTNYGKMAANFRGISQISCMEYLKKLVDLRVADNQTDISLEEDAFLRTYGRAMHAIVFYRRACLIEKAIELPTRRQQVGVPLAAAAQNTSAVSLPLMAHFGFAGDVTGVSGGVRNLDSRGNIQGFRIEPGGVPTVEIEYRARLASGAWTDWAQPGTFVGTRGKGTDLTGFSVRLGDKQLADFQVQLFGIFRDEAELVAVGNGEDCVSRSGRAAMCGMEIVVVARAAAEAVRDTAHAPPQPMV